jgi:hypothetical protein
LFQGSKRNRGKATGLYEEPPNKLAKLSMSPSGELPGFGDGVGNAGLKSGGGNGGGLNVPVPGVTPRETGGLGTPWDELEAGMDILGMDLGVPTDDFRDLGDFGDLDLDDGFWGDEGLDFGEVSVYLANRIIQLLSIVSSNL